MNILFIVNPGSGSNNTDWQKLIRDFFESRSQKADIYELPKDCDLKQLKQTIEERKPDRIVAVGGDGTVKLVANCVLHTDLSMGILPAGSANGLAKELNIPMDPQESLKLVVGDTIRKVHVTEVNDELCIHLSDIGFNAFVVKVFESGSTRGMWGYFRAAFIGLFKSPYMDVTLRAKGEQIQRRAAMIVIANATRYGSGAVINPEGRLDDDKFEVVVVRKISFREIFKMMFTHNKYDPQKTELFQTDGIDIISKSSAHFQVDGEYLGKTKQISAKLIPDALHMVMPEVTLTEEIQNAASA